LPVAADTVNDLVDLPDEDVYRGPAGQRLKCSFTAG